MEGSHHPQEAIEVRSNRLGGPMIGQAPAVLAVDGGNSKTDLVLVAADGTLLGRGHGPTISHQQVGVAELQRRLKQLLADAGGAAVGAGDAGQPALLGLFCVAGADLPSDLRLLRAAFAAVGVAERIDVRNDAFAALRAGTQRAWGIAVICGAGVNCAGIGPDGRVHTLPALGDISGDWGGGGDVGMAALGAALRGRDGRGPRTALERLVPRALGLRRPLSVTHALYAGRLHHHELRRLAPVVFGAARDGDAVARGIADRLADELTATATAMARRMRLARSDVEVVLAGGLVHAEDAAFHARFAAGVRRAVPRAQVRRLTAPPVLGAALLGLEAIGADEDAARRLRAALGA